MMQTSQPHWSIENTYLYFMEALRIMSSGNFAASKLSISIGAAVHSIIAALAPRGRIHCLIQNPRSDLAAR